jgi:hypothetical protein
LYFYVVAYNNIIGNVGILTENAVFADCAFHYMAKVPDFCAFAYFGAVINKTA